MFHLSGLVLLSCNYSNKNNEMMNLVSPFKHIPLKLVVDYVNRFFIFHRLAPLSFHNLYINSLSIYDSNFITIHFTVCSELHFSVCV